MSRQFAWTTSIIDNFKLFVEKHVTDKIDYIFVALCTEAVTKNYLIKLDSLYEDVKKFSTALGSKGMWKRVQLANSVKCLQYFIELNSILWGCDIHIKDVFKQSVLNRK
jgi:hypothetical protein